MLHPEEMFRSMTITSDAGGHILNQVLRGLDVEYKHTSTSMHLASLDIELVDSLLLAPGSNCEDTGSDSTPSE